MTQFNYSLKSQPVWFTQYTGINDFNTRNAKIVPNTNYKTIYYGGNIGLGAEYQIFHRLDIYIEMRFRVTDTDVGFGLSDVCYGGGIKYAIIDGTQLFAGPQLMNQ